MAKTDTQAHLIRAHKALGELIAADAKGTVDTLEEWCAFYDAVSFIEGLEDAAGEQCGYMLNEMGLDDEGYRTNDDGDRYYDNDGYWHRDYVPMTAIYMPVVA